MIRYLPMLGAALCVLLWIPGGVRSDAPPGATPELVCRATDNGSPARAGLEVFSPPGAGRTICGSPLRLPEGQYRVRLTLHGTAHGASRVRSVNLSAGMSGVVEAHFETGELLLMSRREGKPRAISGTIRGNGRALGTLQGDVPARLEAGTYVVDAGSGDRRQRFAAVHVIPGNRTVLLLE